MIHVYLPLNDLLKFSSSKNVFKRLKSKLTILCKRKTAETQTKWKQKHGRNITQNYLIPKIDNPLRQYCRGFGDESLVTGIAE